MNPSTDESRSETGRKPVTGRKRATPTMSDRSAAGIHALRLLVPINANDDSRWGIAYALRLHAAGTAIEVCLLHVGEPVTQWEVLRFRTQDEISRFQSERAETFLEEARQPLAAQDISCRSYFRSGEVVFTILDAAEELACDEIVMPAPLEGLLGLLSKGIVAEIRERNRGSRIVLVDRTGTPLPVA